MKLVTILNDTRPIKTIGMNTDGSFVYSVGGPSNVSKIEAYAETDGTLWFGVYVAGVLCERANARNVAFIVYFDGAPVPQDQQN